MCNFLIFAENYDYLKKYLCELAHPEVCISVQDWSIGGRVFLDYINIIHSLERMKEVGERSVESES